MKSLWFKACAALSSIIGVLLLKNWFQKNEIEDLKDKNAGLEMKDQISDDVELVNRVANEKEVERNEEREKHPESIDDIADKL